MSQRLGRSGPDQDEARHKETPAAAGDRVTPHPGWMLGVSGETRGAAPASARRRRACSDSSPGQTAVNRQQPGLGPGLSRQSERSGRAAKASQAAGRGRRNESVAPLCSL